MESLAIAEGEQENASEPRTPVVRKIATALRGIPIIPVIILTIFVIVGIFGRAISPHDPNEADFMYTLTPPFWQEGGDMKYLLGTDQLGRDLLSRMICGTSISLQIGFIVSVLAGIMGSVVALLSGYLGGKVDTVLMRFTDTMISLPYFIVAIVMASILGPSKNNIIIILAIVGWAAYARVLRGEVLRIKERDFVSLAVTSGCSKLRIMLVHIFPNIVNTLIILVTLRVGIVIIAEASLSFLGVGVPPPNPAWGLMIAEGRSYISSAWWLCVWPGIAIFMVVMSCNLMGDWLRVRLDPKFRQL
jgi:peptide/nickel transport system permease protein